ncbi:MAG: YybH family protein [Phycisphaerales bacterium]
MRESDQDEVAGIRAVWMTWFGGMEAADVEQSLSVVSADVVHEGPDGERRKGRAALGSALSAFHRAYVERVSWELQSAEVTGSVAEVRVHEVATIRERTGGPTLRVEGYHLARLAQQESGDWLIIEDVSRIEGEPTVVEADFEAGDERAGTGFSSEER